MGLFISLIFSLISNIDYFQKKYSFNFVIITLITLLTISGSGAFFLWFRFIKNPVALLSDLESSF